MPPIYTSPVISLEEASPQPKPKLPSRSVREAAGNMLRELSDRSEDSQA